MSAKDRFYCGLKGHITFDSFVQRFEAPLSTSSSEAVALGFADEASGIIIELKRGSRKTRHLDTTLFSCHAHEEERLFMGSTLKIVTISIGRTTFKSAVDALKLFERLISGYFLDAKPLATTKLLSLLNQVTAPTVMDRLNEIKTLSPFLMDEDYETDAIMFDTKQTTTGNIARIIPLRQLADLRVIIEQTHGMCPCLLSGCHVIFTLQLSSEERILHKYEWSLLESFLLRLKALHESRSLWVNFGELAHATNKSIEAALFGRGQLFDCLGIDATRIRSVHEYQWNIVGQEYETLKTAEAGTYIVSPAFSYKHAMEQEQDVTIRFHLWCYAKLSLQSQKCALFVALDEFPESVKRLRIEIDIRCDKKRTFKQLLQSQILTKADRTAGQQVFEYAELERNECIQWRIGVKIFKAEQFDKKELLYRRMAMSM